MSGAGEASPAVPFGDRLAAAVAARESQIVLGVDPDPAHLWPAPDGRLTAAADVLAGALAQAERAAAALAAAAARVPATAPAVAAGDPPGGAAAAVLAHCVALIDAAGPACVAVKPQLAHFERFGFAGWLALQAAIAHARERGLLVIADAKRGDVASTAAAYADAILGGLGADAVTLNPLLGRDALAPFAGRPGTGTFVLVRTSNAGAADLFDAELADGAPLWERIAGFVAEAGEPGPASGLAATGAVTGATEPRHLARMRELMPHAPFLLPGVGAQGGTVDALAAAFVPGRAAGLVSASRSIANAHGQHGGEPAGAARREAERLRAQAWGLG